METVQKIYRVKRDIAEESEVISISADDKVNNIPVEKIISKILHNIITKEDDTKNHENAK